MCEEHRVARLNARLNRVETERRNERRDDAVGTRGRETEARFGGEQFAFSREESVRQEPGREKRSYLVLCASFSVPVCM